MGKKKGHFDPDVTLATFLFKSKGPEQCLSLTVFLQDIASGLTYRLEGKSIQKLDI